MINETGIAVGSLIGYVVLFAWLMYLAKTGRKTDG